MGVSMPCDPYAVLPAKPDLLRLHIILQQSYSHLLPPCHPSIQPASSSIQADTDLASCRTVT